MLVNKTVINFVLSVLFFLGLGGIIFLYITDSKNENITLNAEPIHYEIPVEDKVEEIPEEISIIEEIVTEEVKEPVLSDEDIMAIVAECEAGNQEIIGRVAVVATILNRCDYYGETVETVVYKPNQYAFDKEVVPSEESYLAVKIALRERDLFPDTMMWFLPSGYSSYGKPYMKIQDHYFSYLPEEEE